MPDRRPEEIDNTRYQFSADHDYAGHVIRNLGGRKHDKTVSVAYDDGGDWHEEDYDTIQGAVDAAEGAGGGIVHIGPTYSDNDTWPVTVESTGVVIVSDRGKDELVVDSGGGGVFQISLGNSRPPGFNMIGLSVRDTGPGSNGSPTIDIQDSSYVSLTDVDVDHNNLGGADAYHTVNTGTSAPNSITFTRCTAEQIGGVMWHIESDSHSTAIENCRGHEGGAEGVYFNGLSHQVSVTGSQIQQCDKAGVRVQNAENVHLEDVYFEANGQNTTGGDQAEIKLQNASDNVYINNCWFNGAGSTPRLFNHNASGHATISHLRYDDGYTNVFDLNSGTAEIDRKSVIASGNGDPNVFLIDSAMGKIYDGNTVVGAGSTNGGNDDVSGVDLSTVTGDRENELAVSDGTGNFTSGDVLSWDATNSEWDGGPQLVASGNVTLSSSSAVIATGVTTTGTTIDVALDPSGSGNNAADVKASARAFWDNSAGEYKVEILEDGTAVGNPRIDYKVYA